MTKEYPRPSSELVDFYKTVPAAFVSDACKKNGLNAQNLYLKEVQLQTPKAIASNGIRSICGPAVTYATGPRSGSVPPYEAPYKMGTRLHFEVVEKYAQPGDFVIIGNYGGIHSSMWGGFMTQRAAALGVVGVAVDGAIRDLEYGKEFGVALYSKGRSMISHFILKDIIAEMVPVACAGAIVKPGDLVVADEDGVCIIPLESAEAIRKSVETQIEEEGRIRKHLDSGGSFFEIYQSFHKDKYLK